MNIVVTGGCGYIGSHVARAFKQRDKNNRVYIIDRIHREHTTNGTDGHLINDFASKASLMWLTELEPSVVVHCAGSILVGESVTDPAEYYENNIAKTITLMNHLKGFKRKPVVLFSSSASVYGNPTSEEPLTEKDTVQPISPYGVSKASTERLLQDYNTAYNLPSVCFRYFNACGAEPFNFNLGQAKGASHIIARVLEAKLYDEQFTLNGNDFKTPDGTCIRDYIHVWDLARAHVMAGEWMLAKEKKEAVVVNLGTTLGISNQQIINYVQEQYGALNLNVGGRRPGDPDRLIADATLAHTLFGWKPEHSTLEEIVNSAYKWYNRNIDFK